MTPGEQLEQLYASYEQATALIPLRAQSPLIRGEGMYGAPLMLIGEAPGEEEVRQGRPFVGPSGKLLVLMLGRLNIPRGVCWITNTVLYRPPGNRTPYRFEIAASRERLLAEIEIIQPLLVVTLGAVARHALRPEGPPVSACHGQMEDSREIPTEMTAPGDPLFIEAGCYYKMLPTFHPAAALRDSSVREMMEKDLSQLAPFGLVTKERT